MGHEADIRASRALTQPHSASRMAGLAWLPGLGTGQGTSCSSSALGTPTGIWAAYRGAPPLAPKRCTVRCPLG
jgi:hypothetical protein